MKCKKHHGYQAIRRPRTACEACWRKYIEKHPFVDVLISDEKFWNPERIKKSNYYATHSYLD